MNMMLTLHMTRPSHVATLHPYFVWQLWPDIAAATPLGRSVQHTTLLRWTVKQKQWQLAVVTYTSDPI
jgi:hypothetical protein